MFALRPREIDFPRLWVALKDTIDRIIALKTVKRDVWDDMFYNIYAACVALPDSHAEKLYEATKECIEEHVKLLFAEVAAAKDGDLLTAYHNHWVVYSKGASVMHNLFSYLNKQFIRTQKYTDADLTFGGLTVDPSRSSVVEIGELALDVWRRQLVEPLQTPLVAQLLAATAADRRGESLVAESVVRGVVQSLVDVEQYRQRDDLDFYKSVFEEKFIAATCDYYGAEAVRMLAEYSCSDYMKQVLLRLEEENRRSQRLLHGSSHEKVTKVCQEVMVAAHQTRLHATSRDLVREERRVGPFVAALPHARRAAIRADLANMYVLLKPISLGLSVLVKEFEQHVRRLGLESVQNLTGDNIPHQFVKHILTVFNKYSEMVSSVFQDDQEFSSAMDKVALLATVNHKEESRSCPKASEWLAKYTDFLLRKSAKGLTESEVDEKLAMAIVIFRYIDDKDIFQKFYSRMLAQRLIHGASVSMDAEESMINKLKQACGYEFTSKLQRMFTDVGLSRELTEKFYAELRQRDEALDVQMQVQVLQAGAWPLSAPPAAALAVPPQLQPSVALFDAFYARSYSGRKLTWLYNMASAEVRLLYLDKLYHVTMSVQQLAIMLCFEQRTGCSLSHIRASTEIADDAINKLVRSLLDSGLLKCSAAGHLDDNSTVTLNEAFVQKRLRFKLLTPVMGPRQTERETEHVTATVQQDRKYFMECTIVRIMKTRKVLRHNALVQEVIKQSCSRFSPDINFIKKVVEALIEKQYLQRTEQNDEYAYLA